MSMLDDNSTCFQKVFQLVTFPSEISDSRTSNSSVWNPAEEDSSNNSSPFIFDLLKKENGGSERVEEENTAQTIIRTLFPVSADRGGRVSDSIDNQNEHRILQQKQPQVKKTRRGPRSRSSQYRGVTFYRRTGRWESHIWDCGKQIYLGGFDTAHTAARAYDRAAVMFRGVDADINFNFSDYEEDLKQMRGLSKEEFVLRLRRQSNGNKRRSSTYRSAYGQRDPQITPFQAKTFCHMSQIRCDHKIETNFKGQRITNSNKAGTLHNLDLSLGISPSWKQLNNNDSGCTACIQRETMQEKALVKIKKEVPLQVFSNLTWQIRSNGSSIALRSLKSNAAASSGFLSSPILPIMPTILPLAQPHYTHHHH